MTLATGTNLDMVATQDTSISTGRSFKVRAAELISLFSHKLGMKLMAASGKIDIQAQADNVEVTAAKCINLTALDEIEFRAPKITIITEGAGTEWGSNQIVHKMQGVNTVHAAFYHPTGPASPSLNLPGMPTSEMKTDEQYVVTGRAYQARAGRRYEIADSKNQLQVSGDTEDDGSTKIKQAAIIDPLTLKLK